MQAAPDEYVPIYLLLSDRVDVAQLHQDWTEAGWSQQQRVAALLPLLQAKAKTTQAPLLTYLQAHPQVRPVSLASIWVVNMIFLEARPELVRQLAQRSDIEFIGEDHLPELSATERVDEAPLPPFDQTRESSLETINATGMWQLGYTGYGRKALVIDTGNEVDHPALRTQYLGQWATTPESWNGTGDPVPCIEEEGGLSDHGTHVTGTVCGLDRLTEDTIGVAFDAQWMGGGVFLSGCEGYSSGGVRSILETFQWSLDPDGNPATVSDMPDVINNSWNSPPTSECSDSPYIDLAYTMNAAGIAVVFSASNRGPAPSTIGSPAGIALDLVTIFCVANINTTISGWPISNSSSRGPTLCTVSDSSLLIKPEVGAPGTRIRSAVTGGSYGRFNGTSMAAPHVAGAVLLLREAFPDLLGVQLLEALYYSCTDLGAPGEDNVYGQGMINVLAAYEYLLAAGNEPTPPSSRAREVIALDLQAALINCAEEFSFRFYVENGSPDTMRQLEVYYELDDVASTRGTFNWEGELAPGERLWLDSAPIAAAVGAYRLTVRAALPNGAPDARFLNNQLRTDLVVIAETPAELRSSTRSECVGARSVLQIPGLNPGDEVKWYSQSTDEVLGTGAAFLTPALDETTTFTAQIVRHRTGGLPLTDNNASDIDGRMGGLRFDCHYPITLRSFKVKAEQRGGRIIRLLSNERRVLKSRIVSIPGPGEYTVDFGISIPAAEGYVLEQTDGRPLAYRSSATSYPISLGPVMTITGVTGEDMSRLMYPHFYELEITYDDYCGPLSITLEPMATDQVPTAYFTPSARDLVLGQNEVVRFDNQSVDATSYYWDFGDGASSTALSPSHQYTTPGTYFVSLVAANDASCESAWLDTIHVIIDQTTNSTDLQTGQEALSLFPNPTTGEVYLELPNTTPAGGHLQVMDLNGRILLRQTWQNQLHSVDLSGLPAGVYVLRYEQAGQVLIGKVIKE